ncbi:hypothetical protein SLEP1_g40011 [Rubroshorea leprosula]|uniref:Cyclic nucleotide-binding domain-containing protein n=1 Tax=Rubroshorea leprosula TaxID=152421 RepID=A0AAV5L2F5_9ROSI|nr:hypothetical protein SLEP1_g40011 [Rubroshorea leprosula]
MKLEEMRLATREIKQWKPFKKLPRKLRRKVNEHQQYTWHHTRGVNVEKQLQNLPKELTKDIKRELCLTLLKKVKSFCSKGEKLLDALCFCVRPVLFIEHSHLIETGDRVNEMLFIVEGKLQVSSSSSNEIVHLKDGDFCGEELVEWVQDSNSPPLPVSSRSIQTLTKVEAFALQARDMKRNWDAIRNQAAARLSSAWRRSKRAREVSRTTIDIHVSMVHVK